MNKYVYWISAAAVAALGLVFAMNISIRPETQATVEFTQVSTPEEMGRMISEKLHLEIKESPVLLLGVTPNHIEDLEMWRGLLEANQEPGFKYDVIVVEPMLPYVEIFDPAMRIEMKEEMKRFVEGINNARAQNLRVVAIVPNIYASQLIQMNPVHRLQDEHQIKVLSLSAAKFPVTKEQEASFEPRCVVKGANDPDPSGTGTFGCAIQNIARKGYRQKFEDGKFSTTMEQTSPKDYLVLINRNANSK